MKKLLATAALSMVMAASPAAATDNDERQQAMQFCSFVGELASHTMARRQDGERLQDFIERETAAVVNNPANEDWEVEFLLHAISLFASMAWVEPMAKTQSEAYDAIERFGAIEFSNCMVDMGY